jgi:hypothetical protein
LSHNLFGFGANRFDTLLQTQKELLSTFEQINRERLARVQQETELATKFAGKLTSVRSVPDLMATYQHWLSRRMEMFADDGRKLFEDGQRVINAATRLLSNGSSGRRT